MKKKRYQNHTLNPKRERVQALITVFPRLDIRSNCPQWIDIIILCQISCEQFERMSLAGNTIRACTLSLLYIT
jgi:hypothetical protein